MERRHIELAVDNIAKYGDTDIFPFPIEKLIFFDSRNEVVDYIERIDSKFYEYLPKNPPINITTSCPIGYTGFRWATQIDPFWNGFFLSQVISIAEKIENERIAKDKDVIYSYRYQPIVSESTLFDKDYNWFKFQQDSISFCETSPVSYVVVCDIADFYNRIYHHPLENALRRVDPSNNAAQKIKKLIQKFSNTKSYGLPIGGQAARILAELVLNNTDRLLLANGVRFKRYVDDINIFCASIEEAHQALNFLANRLMRNEGLSLQKHKTMIYSKNEFCKIVSSKLKADSDDERERSRAQFMSLPINYDPYSDTAEADYEKIKSELSHFDIIGLLNEELSKARIHQQFGKQLIKTFDVLDYVIVSNAFDSILERLDLLYPIFPAIMQSAYGNFQRLTVEIQDKLHSVLRELIRNRSYIVQSEINMAYSLRVLGLVNNTENEEILNIAYNRYSDSYLVKSLVFQTMTRWKAYYWLTDKKDNFSSLSKWERRIFIIASCFLGDEGEHWANHYKREFSESEDIIFKWAKGKSKISGWTLPL